MPFSLTLENLSKRIVHAEGKRNRNTFSKIRILSCQVLRAASSFKGSLICIENDPFFLTLDGFKQLISKLGARQQRGGNPISILNFLISLFNP